MDEYKKLTNEVGAPVADNEHSITCLLYTSDAADE